MAHLPVRKKQAPAAPMSLLPMAVVLAAGVLATALVDGARRGPVEVAHDLRTEMVAQALPMAQMAWRDAVAARLPGGGGGRADGSAQDAALPGTTRTGSRLETAPAANLEDLRDIQLDASGHTWIVAESAPITDFKPSEIQPQVITQGWKLVANKVRGVAALNPHAHAYDRLYVDLGGARYVALRWRDIP